MQIRGAHQHAELALLCRINEGRCETTNCTAADIQNWIGSVAPYVRGLTNSLVTVGEEGYYQASNCHANL